MTNPAGIVKAAVAARTLAEAEKVQRMIEATVGARYERPIFDSWNNLGVISAAGVLDHKMIENITNMQDALIERKALGTHGSRTNTPYRNPQEAAQALFPPDSNAVADDLVVEFYESDVPARTTRRLTAVFRDHGCGMTPSSIPRTIFGLGARNKSGVPWLQGAFGLGGKTTFRDARAVVLVTRRAPELLLPGEPDEISIAVLEWQEEGKTRGLYYLVTEPWEEEGTGHALPFTVPTGSAPDFEPGTHLALISHGVEGFHRARLGDERSFDTVVNTRLFRPVLPVRFSNRVVERDRKEYLRGLEKRLVDNPRPDRREGSDTLPYRHNGTTYQLPIEFYVFSRRGEPGERRSYVAYDHAVLFTSNGQVHHHWTPQTFKYKTRLNKLYDRILVVVDTDELPIQMRTQLFTADRSDLVRSDAAVRLEQEVAAFMDNWSELQDINGELIRDAITGTDSDASTLTVAKQISRALSVRGFSFRAQGSSGGGSGGGGGRSGPIDLYVDPTTLEGPETVTTQPATTKFITYILNAVDDFIPSRAALDVTCTHPDITPRETTVGQLRAGRIRVSLLIPTGADLGQYEVGVRVADWMRSSGGIGRTLKWTTQLMVEEEAETHGGSGSGRDTGSRAATQGGNVGVIWTDPESEETWDKNTVGDVQPVPASVLAAKRPEYGELSRLGDTPVPTLMLNKEYTILKHYLGARARDMSDAGMQAKRDQYAVGVGVGLLLLDQDARVKAAREGELGDSWLAAAQQAIARSVLSMMPAYDQLAREAGVTDS